ncbi:Lachesin [Halotydeus destructor]|nr:Lachesin [Halotydeus destructor]
MLTIAVSAMFMFVTCTLILSTGSSAAMVDSDPEFTEPIKNTTVFLGREGSLECSVKNLDDKQVAWLKADPDSGTLYSVQTTIISKDPRLKVTHHSNQKWALHIKEVTESDRGYYMCQINSEPMISQTGYLDVLVPPSISDDETSSDVVVDERNKMSLRCKANGYPMPTITWRREDAKELNLGFYGGKKFAAHKVEGEYLNVSQVTRDDMGAYLCIAKNSVPPSVSKRITVQVNFRPKIRVPNQLVGAAKGTEVYLECRVEASPRPLTSWIRHDQTILLPTTKYQISEEVTSYKIRMKLKITDLEEKDYGAYKCVAKNTLGDKEGYIRLYEVAPPTTLSVPVRSTATTTYIPQKKVHTGSTMVDSDDGHGQDQLLHPSGSMRETAQKRDSYNEAAPSSSGKRRTAKGSSSDSGSLSSSTATSKADKNSIFPSTNYGIIVPLLVALLSRYYNEANLEHVEQAIDTSSILSRNLC